MPVSYTKSGGQGHVYQVPDYPETADGPKAFKDFADFLDLILPPVGTIMPYVGSAAPTGWLLCEGQEVSSSTYPKLATACGTKFGTAAAGMFKLPNLKGRLIAGLDSSQSEFDAIGKTGGAKSVTLTVSNLPAHTHANPDHTHTATISGSTTANEAAHTHSFSGSATTSSDGAHNHGYSDWYPDTASNFDRTGGGNGSTATTIQDSRNTTTTTPHTHTVSISGSTGAGTSHSHSLSGVTVSIASSGASTSGSTGGGAAVTVLSPYITMNHIIRAA